MTLDEYVGSEIKYEIGCLYGCMDNSYKNLNPIEFLKGYEQAINDILEVLDKLRDKWEKQEYSKYQKLIAFAKELYNGYSEMEKPTGNYLDFHDALERIFERAKELDNG